VTQLSAGDEVFGVEASANAEFVTVRESEVIAAKPAGLTYEQAAAIPDGSLLALSCLGAAGPPQGKRVPVKAPPARSERRPSSSSHITSKPR
jgi:NADPH:quinone reductase-like Zn-dependent oxidoreductase